MNTLGSFTIRTLTGLSAFHTGMFRPLRTVSGMTVAQVMTMERWNNTIPRGGSLFQIDEAVAKLLELKLRLGGDDGGKHQFVLKTAKVRPFKHYYV